MHQGSIAGSHFPALDGSRYTFPGERLKVCHRQQLQLLLFRCSQDGCGQGMFALLFQAGNRLQKLGLVNALGGKDGGDFRLALGEGSRLVHDQRIYFFHRLQGFRVADQDPLAGAAAGAHHDGHGRRQAESTGAGDDEHSHGVHQGMRVPRLRAKDCPDRKGDHGRSQDRGDEVRSHPVGKALNGRAASFAPRSPFLRSVPAVWPPQRARLSSPGCRFR